MEKSLSKSQKTEQTLGPEKSRVGKLEKDPKFIVLNNAELGHFIGQPLSNVVSYLETTYGDRVPGLEHANYLNDNFDRTPEELKNGMPFYFLGGKNDNQSPFIVGLRWFSYDSGQHSGFDFTYPSCTDIWDGRQRILLLDK